MFNTTTWVAVYLLNSADRFEQNYPDSYVLTAFVQVPCGPGEYPPTLTVESIQEALDDWDMPHPDLYPVSPLYPDDPNTLQLAESDILYSPHHGRQVLVLKPVAAGPDPWFLADYNVTYAMRRPAAPTAPPAAPPERTEIPMGTLTTRWAAVSVYLRVTPNRFPLPYPTDFVLAGYVQVPQDRPLYMALPAIQAGLAYLSDPAATPPDNHPVYPASVLLELGPVALRPGDYLESQFHGRYTVTHADLQ